jgi:hypothetical protein
MPPNLPSAFPRAASFLQKACEPFTTDKNHTDHVYATQSSISIAGARFGQLQPFFVLGINHQLYKAAHFRSTPAKRYGDLCGIDMVCELFVAQTSVCGTGFRACAFLTFREVRVEPSIPSRALTQRLHRRPPVRLSDALVRSQLPQLKKLFS